MSSPALIVGRLKAFKCTRVRPRCRRCKGCRADPARGEEEGWGESAYGGELVRSSYKLWSCRRRSTTNDWAKHALTNYNAPHRPALLLVIRRSVAELVDCPHSLRLHLIGEQSLYKASDRRRVLVAIEKLVIVWGRSLRKTRTGSPARIFHREYVSRHYFVFRRVIGA